MPRRNLIGERLRETRLKMKPPVTQSDLAARLQVEGLRLERVAISKIETGYREVTDVEALAIAKVLGVGVGWLMGEDGKHEST